MDRSTSEVNNRTPGDVLRPQGIFSLSLMREGKIIFKQDASNSLTYYAKNLLLESIFRGGPIIPPLYFGLAKATTSWDFAPTDTEASHPGWSEFTGYQVACVFDISGAITGSPYNAGYLSRLHSSREPFLGVPHVQVSIGAIGTQAFYSRVLRVGENNVIAGAAGRAVPIDTDANPYSGCVLTDPHHRPTFSINSGATLVGCFLGTSQPWNSTGGNIFATCQFGPCTVSAGDVLSLAYGLQFRQPGDHIVYYSEADHPFV